MALDHTWDVVPLEENKLKEFEAKHGEDNIARVVQTRACKSSPTLRAIAWEIVIRRPVPIEVQTFKSRSKSNDPNQSTRAQEFLIRQILLHPSQEEFGDLVKKWPGLSDAPKMTRALQEMLGWAEEELESK
jgi:hypothetical protein